MAGRLARDDRAVSESMAVAILVGFTVLVLVSVGISVLFVDADSGGPPSANFTFEHFSENSMLLVSHERGDSIPAGDLVLEGEPGTVTWAQVAGTNATDAVEPGDTVQLSRSSAWGERVTSDQRVAIYYVPDPDNRTLLDSWSGG